jgi:tetratricopeptide (TPR) repeat protein
MSGITGGNVGVVTRAAQLIDLRRPEEAARLLAGWLAAHPDDADALCLAARAELALDNLPRAVDRATRAAAADPDAEWPLRLLALARSRQGRHQDAMQAASAAVALAPWAWQTHHVMAHAAVEAPGGIIQAWDAARRACELAPNESDAHTVMGTVALAAGDKVTAEAALTEALRLDPANAIALNELGRVQLGRRNHVGAATIFAQAARSDIRLEAPMHNIDVALTAVSARLFVCAWLVLIFPARAPLLLDGRAAWLGGLGVLALLAGVLAWQGWVLRPLLTGGLRRYVLLLPQRDRELTTIVGLTGLGFVALVLMCVVPLGTPRWACAIAGGVALVACRILLAIRMRRFRKAHD